MGDLRTLQSLTDGLRDHGDRPVLLALQKEGVERWSYMDLADHAGRLARGLAESNVDRGEHVALLAGNRPEWVAACLALAMAGAVVVPLDARLGDEAVAHALGDSGAELVFTTSDQVERLGDGLKPILLDAGNEDERSWRRLLSDGNDELPRVEPEDPAALFYTSGTTGTAKGVPLSHRNLAFQLNTMLGAGLVTGEDRVLLPLPLHHVYPFVIGMLTPLALGLAVVMPQSLTGPQMVRALREGPATIVVGVPRLYGALYSGIEDRSRSGGRIASAIFEATTGASTWLRRRLGLRVGKLLLRPLHRRFGPKLRVLASGGSALDPDLAWKLEGVGWQVAIGYGLTETSPLLTLNPPESSKLGSAGWPIPGVEVRVDPSAVPGKAGEERRTDKPGEEGEILARGPGVFSGYRNMPEETREVLTGDGWFRTGDLGYFDEEGYLYVTGRASTLIVTEGGENVQPEDVEEAYLENPVISEVGVLQRENQLVAVIVPEVGEIRRRDGDIERAVREAVREVSGRLPSYQRLSDYAITREPLQYTQLGKIRRHLLPDHFKRAKEGEERPEETARGPIPPEEMSEEDRAFLENPAAKQVWDGLARRYPDERLTPETSPQLDLGIDSLEWVNLTLEIGESVGVELDEEAIERVDTVRDLLREVTERADAGEGASGASPLENPEEVLSERQKRWLEPLNPAMSILAFVLYNLNRAIARGLFRLRVEGLENLPERGPFILASNHVSYSDPFAIAAAIDYRRLRRTYWAGSMEVAFGNPINRFFVRLAKAVPVESNRAGLSSLAFSAAVLERGKNLIVFPEGQRSFTGDLHPFKPGVGVLLDHFEVPVIPAFIRGTEEAMPPGKPYLRPARIEIAFGQPLDARELERQGEGEEPHHRISSALHDRVAELEHRK